MHLNQDLMRLAQQKVDEQVGEYEGQLVSNLKHQFMSDYPQDTKASFSLLSRRMFGVSNNRLDLLNNDDPLVLKTIRVTGNEQPAESMSFFEAKFNEWLEAKTWHQTRLYQYFYNTQFAFQVFQQFPAGQRVADDEMTFKRAFIWQMPEYDLEHGLKKIWVDTCHLLSTGQLVITPKTQKSGKIIYHNNLPKAKDNDVCHLRPGGKNAQDVVLLPTGQKIARQRFWLNKQYVKDVIL